ncbi:MAG: hypothetical protein JWO91_3589 [Acidobacteriaceae bacterium]|nr:hypothetical protein [Acidobacteriaceae bacterium]
MLSKCSNAACSTLFRSIHRGKLFQVEREVERASTPIPKLARQNSVRKRVEHYWLCDQCSPLFTLTFESRRGIVAVPLTTLLANQDFLAQIPVPTAQPNVFPPSSKKPMHSVRVGLLRPLTKAAKRGVMAGAQ